MTKFTPNEIISLLDVNLKFNLAESTASNLTLGQISNDAFLTELQNLELGYGTSRGHEPLRKEIARRLSISAESVMTTNGSAGSLFLTAFTLCNIGDEIITVSPNFPPTLDIISAIGATKKTITLSFEENYTLNLDQLSDALSTKTRLVILITPHNPSGISMPISSIEMAIKLIEQKSPNAYILIDETYREATYGENQANDSMAGYSERILTTASLSKCHGAPGIRIGWLTCNDPILMEQLTLAKMNTIISCSVLDEMVGLQILNNSQYILAERKQLLHKGVTIVENWVNRNSNFVDWVRPHNGALCCVRLKPEIFNNNEVDNFYAEATKEQIQLASGEWFGEQKRIIRLGFGFLPLQRLEEALILLDRILQSIKK